MEMGAILVIRNDPVPEPPETSPLRRFDDDRAAYSPAPRSFGLRVHHAGEGEGVDAGGSGAAEGADGGVERRPCGDDVVE